MCYVNSLFLRNSICFSHSVSIEAMATIYRLRAMEANESGHANYSSIQSSYSMIQQTKLLPILLVIRSAVSVSVMLVKQEVIMGADSAIHARGELWGALPSVIRAPKTAT